MQPSALEALALDRLDLVVHAAKVKYVCLVRQSLKNLESRPQVDVRWLQLVAHMKIFSEALA
jgi:hypothetical protein